MKTLNSWLLVAGLACTSLAGISLAAEAGKGEAAWLEKAKAEYTLKTCVVSGQALGEMGEPIDFVYKQEGKPDRLVRLCCKACLKSFRSNPGKYLKQLDEQQKAKQ